MKQFGVALILSTVTAVNVKKSRHNPAYDEPVHHHEPVYSEPVYGEPVYTVVEETAHHYEEPVEEVYHEPHHESEVYYTDLQDDPHYEDAYAEPWKPAPRYWDDHLHYTGPTQVNFSKPEPFKAAPVSWRLPEFLPYIPKYKNNYVDVEKKHTYNEFGDLFTPYEFYSPPVEPVYGDPIYDPKNDKLHKKQAPKPKEEDIHDHAEEPEVAPVEEEEHHHEPHHLPHDDEHVVIVHEKCDCSDEAAARDQAIIERDAAVSELALYKLAFGELLPEHTYHEPEPAAEYLDNDHEITVYDPYSYIEDEYAAHQHDDTVYHEPADHSAFIGYFDSDDYSQDGYYEANHDSLEYYDYVLGSYDGYAPPSFHGDGNSGHGHH